MEQTGGGAGQRWLYEEQAVASEGFRGPQKALV